jgi:hypothetical protein
LYIPAHLMFPCDWNPSGPVRGLGFISGHYRPLSRAISYTWGPNEAKARLARQMDKIRSCVARRPKFQSHNLVFFSVLDKSH